MNVRRTQIDLRGGDTNRRGLNPDRWGLDINAPRRNIHRTAIDPHAGAAGKADVPRRDRMIEDGFMLADTGVIRVVGVVLAVPGRGRRIVGAVLLGERRAWKCQKGTGGGDYGKLDHSHSP